ncbi:Mu transposase C-terminal domain-containing protein [Luteibacter yeojuensis]|uniref:Mu transposase C-terminal domain-containing protein n=1 Tax=Luteibacter yeojuensis TaxID=345309 RepID=UPI0006984357|nr:Mu transposase C-terminal domain-containing protein [Luteibacter yeojuensis]
MSKKTLNTPNLPASPILVQAACWLDPHQVVFVDDEVCIIEARLGPAMLRVLNVKTQATSEVSIARVKPLRPHRSGTKDDAVSPEERERSQSLNLHLQPYVNQRTVSMAVTRAIAQAYGVGTRQVRRYLAAFRREPRAANLVRGKRGRATGTRRLPEPIERIIQHVIAKHYSRREKVTKQEVIDRVAALCRRRGLSPPHSGSVLLRLRDAEGYALSVKREGRKQARQRWEPRLGCIGDLRPLQVIQIDHTRVDLILLSDDRLTEIGRPWLTLAIDVATRVVVGFYVSMSAPSSVSVSMCLSHAVLPKLEHGVDGIDYPVFGYLEEVRADNAKELSGPTLKQGCAEHGIALKWRPLGKAHYGGHIERLNGTLMRMVHTVPGTTFSNVAQRKDYPSEAKAILTLEEFRQWLTRQICLRYHTRVHRGLGVPPLVAWQRYWQAQAEQGVYPRVPIDPAMFYVDFLPLVERVIQRGGVHVDNRRYWHQALAASMNQSVSVRVDPRDRGSIWVTTPDGGRVQALMVAEDGRQVAMTAAERSYAMSLHDRAFEVSDAIVREAKRQKYQARRSDATPSSTKPSASTADEAAAPSWTDADIQLALQSPLSAENDHG